MNFYNVPIGFGLALTRNEAAMIRYAHLDKKSKKDILEHAHNARSKKDMYTLVASLVNSTTQ